MSYRNLTDKVKYTAAALALAGTLSGAPGCAPKAADMLPQDIPVEGQRKTEITYSNGMYTVKWPIRGTDYTASDSSRDLQMARDMAQNSALNLEVIVSRHPDLLGRLDTNGDKDIEGREFVRISQIIGDKVITGTATPQGVEGYIEREPTQPAPKPSTENPSIPQDFYDKAKQILGDEKPVVYSTTKNSGDRAYIAFSQTGDKLFRDTAEVVAKYLQIRQQNYTPNNALNDLLASFAEKDNDGIGTDSEVQKFTGTINEYIRKQQEVGQQQGEELQKVQEDLEKQAEEMRQRIRQSRKNK